MTKRLYYDCPIKALYMMKEFGVVFITGDMGYYNYDDCLPYTLEHLSTRKKFYVAEESESIFEPKLRDKGINQDGALFYYDSEGNWISEYFPEPASDYDKIKIIMRDNKYFMDAKKEGEDE